jgi:hypothetical protein
MPAENEPAMSIFGSDATDAYRLGDKRQRNSGSDSDLEDSTTRSILLQQLDEVCATP